MSDKNAFPRLINEKLSEAVSAANDALPRNAEGELDKITWSGLFLNKKNVGVPQFSPIPDDDEAKDESFDDNVVEDTEPLVENHDIEDNDSTDESDAVIEDNDSPVADDDDSTDEDDDDLAGENDTVTVDDDNNTAEDEEYGFYSTYRPGAYCSSYDLDNIEDYVVAEKIYCAHCGAEIFDGQAFCAKCGSKAIGKLDEVVVEKNSRKNRIIRDGLVGVALLFALALVVLFMPSNINLETIYNDHCSSDYATISENGKVLTIDTNPENIEDMFVTEAYDAIVAVNSALNIDPEVLVCINKTTGNDGVQTAYEKDLEITWTYHPGTGLEITYTVVG